MILNYGKYKGWHLSKVPEFYLNWQIDEAKTKIATFEAELKRRENQEYADLSMAERIIQSGYHNLAKIYHPDYGGSNDGMRILNATYEELKRQAQSFRDEE